jgi:hypothetical protein
MEDRHLDELDPKLRQQLQQLKDVPEREPGPAATNRAKYMAMARRMAVERRAAIQAGQRTAVSATPFLRLKEWIGSIIYPFHRKERFSMVSVLATIAIVLGLVFGGAGATVYAAQDSQPGEALYNVKTFSEDVRLELTTDPQAKFQLALALANQRALEIGTLIQEGELVPPVIATRLQEHMQLAFNLAAGMDDESVQTASLLELKRQILDQDRVMGQTRSNAPGDTDPVLEQLRWQNQNQLKVVEAGLENPLQFQMRFHSGDQDLDEVPVDDAAIEDPGSQDGSYGPGPGPGPNDTPGEDQVGPMGPNENPPAGDGYGPGPADCDPQTTCEPAYDGSGTQNGPNNPEPGNTNPGGPNPAEPQAPSPPPTNGGGTGGNKP